MKQGHLETDAFWGSELEETKEKHRTGALLSRQPPLSHWGSEANVWDAHRVLKVPCKDICVPAFLVVTRVSSVQEYPNGI